MSRLKRRRVSGEDGLSADTPEPPRRSTTFWFDDGNVVLQAEEQLFRVHRSMLTRHSVVLRDMLAVQQPEPKPPQDKVELVEGCLVISLTDRADDVRTILSIFYDNLSFIDVRKHLPITTLAAVLRLGKKYQIGYLCKEALGRLRSEYNTTLEGWDETYGDALGGPSIDFYSPSPSKVISTVLCLGHEHGIPSIMPGAFMDYVYFSTLEEILEDDQLPQELRNRCLLGRDQLVQKLRSVQGSWMDQRCFMSPANCTIKGKCDKKPILAALDKDMWISDEGAVWSLCPTISPSTQNKVDNLCPSCAESVVTHYHDARRDMWENLPGFFGYPDWEELKDFDA